MSNDPVMAKDSALRPRAGSWVTAEFGIALTDRGSPVGLSMADLIAVGLRRNPRRAQLLVSTILGKHLAADPRVIAGTGRLLGALVVRTLTTGDSPVPASWITAARQTVSGEAPRALIEMLNAVPSADSESAVLTLGLAETATSLGHLVADQLQSRYLHSTRRTDGSVPVTAAFAEMHSHATGHLLRPDPSALLDGTGPVVLVDDELSTGRTALSVIQALHAIAPHERYVLAGLVDVRSTGDDRNRATVADHLRCRIDVVSLVQGEIIVPPGTVDRVAAEMAAQDETHGIDLGRGSDVGNRRMELPWPADVPTGGRHGFVDKDRPAFGVAIARASAVLSSECGSATRILVLGTEELMYLPLRLALELARNPLLQIAFQSTTRSPVHAINQAGYPIRRRIDFQSTILGGDRELVIRHLYNAGWPIESQNHPAEADLIVVIDDGHALTGPTGVAAAVGGATGVPVLLATVGSDTR